MSESESRIASKCENASFPPQFHNYIKRHGAQTVKIAFECFLFSNGVLWVAHSHGRGGMRRRWYSFNKRVLHQFAIVQEIQSKK